MPSQTPRELGYRMPAEWEPHAATWLSWPRPDGLSFPDRHDEVLPTFGEIVRALAPHEPVHINVRNDEVESIARRTVGERVENVFYHRIPTYEPWCRDHGPTFVTKARNPKSEIRNSPASELAVVDWRYNAYGNKYRLYEDDDAVPQRIAELLKLPLFNPGIVLEGGSIDVNGAGTVLTTTSVLLNPNRNPQLNQQQIEQYLRDYLGVTNVLWLAEGIAGDDTDGHVDDLTRFVNPTTVVTIVERDPHDVNYPALQENLNRLRSMRDQDGQPLRVVELPMPGVVEYDGKRLPASYANFYIANRVVLLPTYRNPATDNTATGILQNLFPDRRVVGIDSTNLIWGLGSFHCLTQQQPAV
ncbi:MAG TPA: agmatine deiminase family protein [Verrucomicrobiae bacterium]|nr:agmatine deiminase family protein [Verrucomicrobiae bacterium]